jgi:hypothetical protein
MVKCEVESKRVARSNKSRTYLIPLLSKEIDIEFEYLISNSYLKFNRDIGQIEYPIAILYELENTQAWDEYSTYLIHHPLFYRSFIINMTHKLYIFNFPEEYRMEYRLFKEGKYSKFSNEAKSLIISYSAEAYKYPPLIEDITGVLYKHITRRAKLEKLLDMVLPKDIELASRVEFDKETFLFL